MPPLLLFSHVSRAVALALIVLALPASAQTTISGTVSDTDGVSLPGVNVYLSGTQRGSATDASGRFEITGVPPGAYRVVASILGYKAATEDVRVGTEPVRALAFRLEPAVSTLGDVEVAAEGDARFKRRLERFVKILVGESENADSTTVTNPWVLEFRDRFGTFSATTTAPLVIENRALGYRLHYDLHKFEATDVQIRYDGDERFEEIEPATDAEAARWAIARAQAYRGSLRHLLQSLLAGTADAEGFEFMVRRMNSEGMLTDYVGRTVEGKDLLAEADEPGWKRLAYDGLLKVTYTREPEVPAYLQSEWFREGRSRPNAFQESNLKLDAPSVLIDPKGDPEDPFGISASGYLAFERLADLVPAEYVPPTEGVQSTIQARRPPSRGTGRGQ